MGNNSKYIETADWRKRQSAIPSPAPGVGVEKPGFKRQPEYYTMSETAEKSPAQEAPAETQPSPETTEPSAGESTAGQSDAVSRAQQMLQEQMNQKPGGYQSAWQAQLDEILGKILNREEFNYDLNGDALYQQYKDQYMMQGRQAMMDTMGQAAALTGGYGNSYAQTAGQQAYQGHIQQLNDRIPELYQLALSKYQMEGNALADQYAMIGAREEQDYARHQDDVNAYYDELDRLMDQYYAERDFAYGQERDQVADEQWQKEFDEAKRRYDQEWAAVQAETSGGSGGSGGSDGGSGGPVDLAGYENQIKNATSANNAWAVVQKMIDSGVSEEEAFAMFEKYFDTVPSYVGGTEVSTNPVRKDYMYNFVRT